MMDKAWSSIEEVLYYFSRSYDTCKVIRLEKSSIFTQIGRFQTVTQAWIYRWLRNDAWSSMVEVTYCFSRLYVKFQGHTALKIVEFDPNWAFPDCNSSLTDGYEMLHKAWNSEGEMPYCFPRSSIKFQGHTRQNHRFWPKLGVSRL